MSSTREKRKRKGWRHEVELAAALNQIPIGYRPEDGKPLFMFTHEEMKQLKPAKVIEQWRRDHDPIRHEDGGPEEHWNLTWRPTKAHEKKSGKEQTQRGKDRKIARRLDRHAVAMAKKHGVEIDSSKPYAITREGRFGALATAELIEATMSGPAPKPKAIMAGSKASKYKKKLNGKTELRK